MALNIPRRIIGSFQDATSNWEWVRDKLRTQLFQTGSGGSKLLGSELNLQNFFLPLAGAQNMTNPGADITGFTYTTTAAGRFLVLLSLDINETVAGSVVNLGTCIVDGVQETAFLADVDAVGRRNPQAFWIVNTGSGKVIKCQQAKFVNAGTVQIHATSSMFAVIQIG